MKYMVMECHPGYAVVLSDDGNFLKVANMHYEVGQTVADVIEMQYPLPEKKKKSRWIYTIAATAACLALIITSVFRMEHGTAYASVYMRINPEVRIDVTRDDLVVGLDGVNEDGEKLADNYNFTEKKLDQVMDELVDKAADQGYLQEGGRISLTLDADDDEWVVSHSASLKDHLNHHLEERMSVTIEVTNDSYKDNKVTIPVYPDASGYGDDGDSGYGESGYGNSEYD